MTDVVQFAILGMASGSLLALLALGLVIVYRGSGVVNFGHGAIGMVGTYVFWELDVHAGWAYLPAFVGGVLSCAALGFLIHLLIMRPLRSAAPVTRMIGTLGVLTVLVEASGHIYPSDVQVIHPVLPTGTVHLLGATIGADKLILLGISLALAAILGAIYTRTQFGRATTASIENPRALAALGYSADRIAAVNWIVGSSLAGVAGILLAPITGLQVTQLTLLVFPALAAAVVGRLTSFPLTVVGGLVIGIIQSEISRYVASPGWADAAPFLLILVVLIVRGHDRSQRTRIAERLPRLGTGRVRPQIVIPVAVAALVVVQLNLPADWLDSITTTVAVAVILLSFVVVTGYSGQLSLAQFAFAGWGAWVAGRIVATTDIPFLLAVAIALLATLPLGLILGAICLRTRGVYLAIATMGLAVTLEHLIFTNAKYTGGVTGTVVGTPKPLGFDIDAILHPERYASVCIVVFLVVALIVANVRRGRSGRRLLATRANERAAASLGVDTTSAKLFAFGLSSMIAALGGILLAFRSPVIVYTSFNTLDSVQFVAQSVVGGIGWIAGPLIGGLGQVGGIITRALTPLGGGVSSYVPLGAGVLLLLTIVQAPDGAAALMWRQMNGLIPARWRKPPKPPAFADGGGAPRRVKPRTLSVDHVTVAFGGVRALHDVSLTIAPGEILGLIGPNGAGKTTLIDTVTGFVRPRDGTVRLDDKMLTTTSPSRIARAGLTRSFQSLELFDDMTVLDNLRTASEPDDLRAYLTDLGLPTTPPLSAAVHAAVMDFKLDDCLSDLPTDLPYGRRRLLAIARAVAVEPSVLCLDEPAAGLDDAEREELSTLLRRLSHDWGMGILLVEHDTDLVMRTCDRITVLNFGEQIATGTPAEVRNDPAVIASYLGEVSEEQAVSA
ncbi:MAG TPA: ATP-binding cassette domain-containing protein [Baekduia sp.]